MGDSAALLEATRRIVAQLRLRIAVIASVGTTRRVSVHVADGCPMEFGHMATVADCVDWIVLEHAVGLGNPPEVAQGTSAVEPVWQGARCTSRTDSEGGISYFGCGYGSSRRSRIDGTEDTQILTVLGVLAG